LVNLNIFFITAFVKIFNTIYILEMFIAYHPTYNHPVPEGHKFPMQKYDDVYHHLLQNPSFKDTTFIRPDLCDKSTLALAHDHQYIDNILSLNIERKEERRIGFILDEAIVIRERHIMQGTLELSLLALEHNSCGINIAGGTHHAFSNKGEGFCIFNDLAISASYLLQKGLCHNILIIDCDVHQGNGTAEIFNAHPQVFTFSMHGKNNYPFEKETSDLDIELNDGTEDHEYLKYLEQSLDFILNIFEPDFIFYQCGVDILHTDKMGKLKVTPQGCLERDKIVFNLAKKLNVPIVCALGGGYSKDLSVITQQHLHTFELAHALFNNKYA